MSSSESEDAAPEEKVFTSTEDEQSGGEDEGSDNDDSPLVVHVVESPKEQKKTKRQRKIKKSDVGGVVVGARRSLRARPVPAKNKGASEQSVETSSDSEVEDAKKETVFTSSDNDSDSPEVVEVEDSPKKGQRKRDDGGKAPVTPATAAGGGVKWKLRSTAKRSDKSNYCEYSTSEDDSDFQDDTESEEEKPRKRKAFNSSPESSTGGGRKRKAPTRTKSASFKKRKSSEKTKRNVKSIACYFGGKPPQSKEEKEREIKRRKIDPATRAFLESGVPDVVIKAQKVVEKKKEESDFLSTVSFFPRLSFVPNNDGEECLLETDESSLDANNSLRLKRKSQEVEDVGEDVTIEESSCFRSFIATETNQLDLRTSMCCPNLETINLPVKMPVKSNGSELPWIDRFKVDSYKDLICDSNGLSTFAQWLKQWKTDIKDDGGASRKIVKRKRKDSDSDFVTSDDEGDEVKKKSVLLAGPPGCGKTTAVYVTARHYGFHVVEVNFSSRRSGKEVLQRVEEAVLSHGVESSSNCLLLFKDIDLLDNEEDEGFHAAVAQLITTAVRPIVMTTSKEVYSALDPKIEKKDPLKICFEYPKSSTLVNRVLIPIIESQRGKDIQNMKRMFQALLQSISLHGRGDIRQVINQVQFLFSSNTPITTEMVHQHSVQQDRILDLGFIQATKQLTTVEEDVSDDEDLCMTLKARKTKQLTDLSKICESLESLGDMDFVGGIRRRINKAVYDDDATLSSEVQVLKSTYSNPNFNSVARWTSEDSALKKVLTKCTFESEAEVTNAEGFYKLGDEVAEYLDFPYAEGAWETAACLRTIVKRNMMDSVGRLAKRNGRLTCYFNRLDRRFMDRICKSFSYDQELEMAKGILKDCPL